MSILVIGSIHMDQNYRLDHLPERGETILAEEAYKSLGGKGLNQAIACARCGGQVDLLGSVGEDEEGRKIKSFLKEEGFNPSYILDQEGPTGAACIYVDKNGDNTIVVNPGADWKIRPEDLEEKSFLFKKADYLVLQFELPLEIVYRALEIGKDYGLTTLVNPAPGNPSFKEDYYSYIDYLIPNETELSILTGGPLEGYGEEDRARSLLEKGVGKLVLTQGARGSSLFTKEEHFHLPSKTCLVKDTTGAGDSYLGAFVHGLAQGKKDREAMAFATSYAQKSIGRFGAIESMVDLRKSK